jgi:hypothetical protein
MKFIRNMAALVVAVLLMAGIILAQHDYQMRLSESGWTQAGVSDGGNSQSPQAADQHLVMR